MSDWILTKDRRPSIIKGYDYARPERYCERSNIVQIISPEGKTELAKLARIYDFGDVTYEWHMPNSLKAYSLYEVVKWRKYGWQCN